MNNGGPAFPRAIHIPGEGTEILEGMTLRDYFAAKAMAAMLYDFPNMTNELNSVAETAYLAADAMLKAREENQPG